MQHLISSEQFNQENLALLFHLTDQIKNNPGAYKKSLKGKIVATIFCEPSTRTRLSFESAAMRLGARILTAENASENSSVCKGESLEDTIRVIGGYADAIVMRHPENDSAERAALVAQVPFLNGGSGSKEHPTQALLDLYSINAQHGHLDKLKVAVMGDLKYGRTVHSLLKMLALYPGLQVEALSAPELALPAEFIELFKKRRVKYTQARALKEVSKDVDVIYHTRIQAERLQNEGISMEKALFVLDKKSFRTFSAQTILLHPLPRREEIAPEIDADPRALYFLQAQNGVYVRMALLFDLLSGKSVL